MTDLRARNAQIAEQYESGLTMEQVGKLHGITRERVRQILGQEGVKSRPSSPPRGVCSLNGCNEPHSALGYCKKHYSRLRNTGSVYVVRFHRRPLVAFLQRIRRERGHWLWAGSLCGSDYTVPKFRVGNNARRFIKGRFEDISGKWVIPICGEDLCVRPDHLLAVSPSQAIRFRRHGYALDEGES